MGSDAGVVYRRAFARIAGRALLRGAPLAVAAGACLGASVAMVVTDAPWLERLLIDSALLGRLLALVACPAVALVLTDLFVGLEAAQTFLAADEKNLDDVWASLGFDPRRALVRPRRLALHALAFILYFLAWASMRAGLEVYLDHGADKSHLAWMPLLGDSPLFYGAFLTMLAAAFLDRAVLVDLRRAPLRHWSADRRWAFVLQRQFFALACALVIFGAAFVAFNRWAA